MNQITIRKIEQKSIKNSDYFEYIKFVKLNFEEIPWIEQIENLYSELLLLYSENHFISGIAVFKVCPEDVELTEEAKKIFGSFIFLSCLFTKPEYRNKGYGYKLLEHAISEIVVSGYKCIGIVDNINLTLIESYSKNFSISIIPVNSKISFIEFKPL